MGSRLLTELPDAVVVIDGQGRVQWANTAAERLVGRPLHDSIGMSSLDLVHPEDLEFVLLSLESIHGKEIGTPIEVRLATSSGWRLMELIGAPVPWVDNGSVLLSMRDLTERRRFELVHDHDARFRTLVQSAATVTMLVSPDGLVVSCSGALTRTLGHDPEVFEGRPLVDLVVEQDRPAVVDALECASQGASTACPVTVTARLCRHGTNRSVPFELALVNLIDDPTVGGYVVSGHDVTDRTVAEFELRKALSLLTATLHATADGIVVVDTEGRFTNFNRRFVDMWRLPESILSTGDKVAAGAYVRDQLVATDMPFEPVTDVYTQGEFESTDLLEFRDGRVFERCSKPQLVDGEIVGRVWSFRDVTDRKRLEERLSFQAYHDSLTGLGNRASFEDRLQHAIERIDRNNGQLAVLFVDLDNLKAINDTRGHAVGDQVLLATATSLVSCLRKSDTAARLGGDEFGVILEDLTAPDEAFGLAERIVEAIRRPIAVGASEVSATVSIGVAIGGPGATSGRLLANADLAMYSAKNRGKDRLAVFEEGTPITG